MSEHGEQQPADVLRTKRLEIGEEGDKVRAVLSTNDEGVTSLSVLDQGGTLRASLDASGRPEQVNGLGVFDASGNLQTSLGARAITERGGGLSYYDANGERRAAFGLNEDGQAGLSFSAAEKVRHIKMAAWKVGNLYLMLTESGMPMATLGLTESEGKVLPFDLALTGKDGRSGVVVNGGRSFDPFVRLMDRHQRVRGNQFAAGRCR